MIYINTDSITTDDTIVPISVPMMALKTVLTFCCHAISICLLEFLTFLELMCLTLEKKHLLNFFFVAMKRNFQWI